VPHGSLALLPLAWGDATHWAAVRAWADGPVAGVLGSDLAAPLTALGPLLETLAWARAPAWLCLDAHRDFSVALLEAARAQPERWRVTLVDGPELGAAGGSAAGDAAGLVRGAASRDDAGDDSDRVPRAFATERHAIVRLEHIA
jgi:hypothetical protein